MRKCNILWRSSGTTGGNWIRGAGADRDGQAGGVWRMRSSAKVWVGIFTACALALAAGAALGQEKTARDAWRTHKDPTGFQVTLPAKWHAAGDAGTGPIELRGAAGAASAGWA